jgi:hypothetical protein
MKYAQGLISALLLTCGILAVSTGSATAGIEPDYWNCEAIMACPGPAWVVNCPAGDGESLDEARDSYGTPVDATITLYLYDINYDPIVYYPATDLWLVTEDNEIAICPGGTVADADTDYNGQTTFSGPFQAGGCGSGVVVMISGVPLPQPPLDLHFISPDFNGDQLVDLTDVVLFSQAYFGTYGECFDLRHDAMLNLSDLVVLAPHWGHHCP